MSQKERGIAAVEAFTKLFPRIKDHAGIMNVFCRGVEWADEHPIDANKGTLTVQPKSPWVSVDERMPDKRKDKNGFTDGISVEVLAKTDKGERVTAWYSYQIDTWFMCMGEICGESVLPYRVVAWMDIPE